MKKNLVYLLFSVALFTSCSSAYRTSQTPDDVYYSPGNKIYTQDQYESYPSSSDDEYLRMKVRDRERWASIDDYDYWYDSRYYANNYYSPYTSGFSLGLGYNTFYPFYSYSPYWYSPWQSWYNPYYTVVYYKNPTVYYRPVSKYNLSTYNNRTYNNYNMPLQSGNRSNAYNNSNYTNRNNNNNNYYRQQQNNNNNNYTPSRSFNNSSSTNSGGGGSHVSGGGSRSRP